MSNNIITAENISKRFILSHEGNERYTALRDVIAKNIKGLFSTDKHKQNIEEFWALKDLNFEIEQGDRVGIIGRNGAGKSTLLKILSRITEPTTGHIKIKGRVSSLLEVGTGFHPELTGRENIYLNGAILGMSRKEIKSKFDEIVDFAEIEKFLDTPVKRYSSGMYVRLAFSVAAHLEPEILIVDEVLAVGDAQFQKKCLGKMDDVSKKEGRSILFVSHNMDAVSNLCSKGIYLKKGEIVSIDEVRKVIETYLRDNKNTEIRNTFVDPAKPKILNIELDPIELSKGNLKVSVEYNWPFDVNPNVGLTFSTMFGSTIYGTNFKLHHNDSLDIHTKRGIATFYVDDIPLHSGSYNISAYLGDGYQDSDILFDAITFDFISQSDICESIQPANYWSFELSRTMGVETNGMKLFSIIIPAYNAANTIAQTLDSVFNQKQISADDIEIIVVNDGSTDNTLSVLKKYEPHCTIITTENKGVSHARNLGLSYAKGSFVQYLDSDDLLAEDKLHKQYLALENTGADIAYGDYKEFYTVKEELIITGHKQVQFKDKDEVGIFLEHWSPPATLLFRKTFLDKLPKWNANLPVIQDARYLFEAARAGAKFVKVPDNVAFYRIQNPNSLSKQNPKKFLDDIFQNTKEVYTLWQEDNDFHGEKRTAIISSLEHCIHRYAANDWEKLDEAIALLLSIAPKYVPQNRFLRMLSRVLSLKHTMKIAGLKRRWL